MPSANGDPVEGSEPKAKKKTRLSSGVKQKNEAELFGEVAESCGLSYNALSVEELRMHGSMSETETELEAYLKVGGLWCPRYLRDQTLRYICKPAELHQPASLGF